MDDSTWIPVIVGLVMAAGLAGTVVPFLPGLPLIWGAALGYGIATEFGAAGWIAMTLITALLAIGIAAKLVLPKRRAEHTGAPKSTLTVGAIGGLVGFFLVPVVGLPLGAITGVLLAEYRRTSDWAAARHSTKEVAIGFGLGTLAEIGAGAAMIACWVVWALVAG